MLVTVITVVRNDHSGLAKTIASVRSQSHSQIEFLVIDGASNDGTIDVIRANEDIIDQWQSQADEGIYDAMNTGLSLATGQLILFLNAGDELLASHSLATVVTAAREHPEADVLYFQAIRDNGGRAGRFNHQSALLFDSIGNHQAIFFRASVHKRFPFDISYRIKADRDVQLRMYLAGCRMAFVPKMVSRVESGGISSTAIPRKEWENLLICQRNRVGLRATVMAVCLAAMRLSLYSLARGCGFNWESAKTIWNARISGSGISRPALQCQPMVLSPSCDSAWAASASRSGCARAIRPGRSGSA